MQAAYVSLQKEHGNSNQLQANESLICILTPNEYTRDAVMVMNMSP